MTVYLLSTWKCLSFREPLFRHHCFLEVVFSTLHYSEVTERIFTTAHEVFLVSASTPYKGFTVLPF
jgi:hypothetical protein